MRFGGAVRLAFAHRRLHEIPYWGGYSSFRESCSDEQLAALGAAMLDATGHDGVAMVEFRRSRVDGQPYFLEINSLPSLEPGECIYDYAALEGLHF